VRFFCGVKVSGAIRRLEEEKMAGGVFRFKT